MSRFDLDDDGERRISRVGERVGARMKAITLTQPWATLVAIGAKRIETRSWKTNYRGPLAIHAAKSMPEFAEMACYDEPFFELLRDHFGSAMVRKPAHQWFTRGAVIAVCQLDRCVQVRQTGDEIALAAYREVATQYEAQFGDYSVGRWMWFLREVQLLSEPLPVRGELGLWELQSDPVPA